MSASFCCDSLESAPMKRVSFPSRSRGGSRVRRLKSGRSVSRSRGGRSSGRSDIQDLLRKLEEKAALSKTEKAKDRFTLESDNTVDRLIAILMEAADGNVSLAARRAGMDRAYLHRLLKKHGIS